MQYKDGRIVAIISEYSVSGNTYNINGINLSYAVFFVREDRKKFRALLPAEYMISSNGANVTLNIQDGVLNNCIAVQIGYDLKKLSSDYNISRNPDITLLKDKYNLLVKDMENLWEYIKKQGVTSDVMNVDVVIPSLAEGETYIMRNGSIEATPLISAEDELQKLLDKLIQNSQGVLDGYVELLKNDIENQAKIFFEENKKEFLNKTEVRKEISYATGTEYKQSNIFGTELKSIEAGETYYNSTKPYMAIKTAIKVSGFLAPDTTNFTDITNKILKEEIANLSGGKFSGFFGTSLTSAIKDNVYYYYDTVKAINIHYLCILGYTNSSGILVPNTTNFIEIDNSYLAKKTLQFNGVNTFPGYFDVAGTRRLFFSVLFLATDGVLGTVANLPFPVKNILDMQCTDVGAGANTTAISNVGNTAVRVWGKDSNGTYIQTLIRVEVLATI